MVLCLDDEAATSELTEEQIKEGERLFKREQAIQKALRVLLKKNPDGVAVPEVKTKLVELGVKNFKCSMLNDDDDKPFESWEDLLRSMPDFVLTFVDGDPCRIEKGSS